MKLLPNSFFRRLAEVVAPELLGATIVSGSGGSRASGVIIETEAYLGFDDPASHAYQVGHPAAARAGERPAAD